MKEKEKDVFHFQQKIWWFLALAAAVLEKITDSADHSGSVCVIREDQLEQQNGGLWLI